MVSFKFATAVTLFVVALSGTADAACQRYVDAAKVAAQNLQNNYYRNGGYPDQWVWLSAVNVYYLKQLDMLTGQSTYANIINTAFNGYENHLDYGGSFDDVQWVSIAYERVGNHDLAKKYYNIASQAWDTAYCGGGLFWSGARDYKNAITSELYMVTSGYLYDRIGGAQYLENLKKTWAWLKSTRMRGSNGLFNDGLTKDGQCNNNNQIQWTYNQGVVLVGLGYIYKHTGDQSALNDAYAILDSIIANLTNNKGLRERCETVSQNLCNADQQSFKGITMHYIAWWLKITGKDRDYKYKAFIISQADHVLEYAVGPPGWYSNLWYDANQGAAVWNGVTQASALGALLAAAEQNC